MWQPGRQATRKWKENEKMKRKWRENEEMEKKLRENEERERKWRENEEMKRKWRENEEMERDSLSTFSHFLPLYPFPIPKIFSFCREMLNTALLLRMSQNLTCSL